MTDLRASEKGSNLPDSWYPVCCSHQLKHGQPLAIRALGNDWVAFRAANGRSTVVQRYCCHMGTDLALGCVIGDELQCPLHRWRFDGDGRCVKIPASGRIPAAARLAKLRCVERFGIVFVGHGPESLFDFPTFPDAGDVAHSRPKLVPLSAPYETVSLNLFDVQHLITTHQRRLHEPAELFSDGSCHLGIRYSAYNAKERLGNHLVRLLGMSAKNIRVDCWGGNLLFIAIEGRRPDFIMALLPGEDDSCRMFLVAVESSRSSNPFSVFAHRIKLETAAALTRVFITEDIRILSNTRAFPGVLLPDTDVEAIRFWMYFRKLPKSRALSAT